MLKNHIDALKEKAASKEKENASQKEKYKADIQKLTEELEMNKALYNQNIVTLTEEKCDLRVKVKEFETQEEKLKKEIETAKLKTSEAEKKNLELEKQIMEAEKNKLAEDLKLMTQRCKEMEIKAAKSN